MAATFEIRSRPGEGTTDSGAAAARLRTHAPPVAVRRRPWPRRADRRRRRGGAPPAFVRVASRSVLRLDSNQRRSSVPDMLVRERIDPHFDVPRRQSRRAEAPRASSARVGAALDRVTAALGALRPSQLAGILRLSKRDAPGDADSASAPWRRSPTNGLVLQSGPHPAPIFAIRPLPRRARGDRRDRATAAAAPERRRRSRSGASGRAGVPLPRSRPQNPQRTALRADPIADIINPGARSAPCSGCSTNSATGRSR